MKEKQDSKSINYLKQYTTEGKIVELEKARTEIELLKAEIENLKKQIIRPKKSKSNWMTHLKIYDDNHNNYTSDDEETPKKSKSNWMSHLKLYDNNHIDDFEEEKEEQKNITKSPMTIKGGIQMSSNDLINLF